MMNKLNVRQHRINGFTPATGSQTPTECFIEACDVCQELEDLEKQMNATCNVPQDLAQKLIALKTMRNTDHDHLGNKMPVEIMNQIFLCLDGTNSDSFNRCVSPLPINYICYSAVLSSVCGRWRDIALSLPELWTNMNINLLRVKSDHLDVAKEWLERSGSLPLNLTLYTPKSKDPKDRSSVVTMINLLRFHSVRWEYLDIRYAPGYTLYLLFNNLEHMPTSESMNLRLADYIRRHSIIVLPTPLQPRRISSLNSEIDEAITLGWSNLMYLEIFQPRTLLILEIISQAPELKHCKVKHPNSYPGNISMPVISNSLQHLECGASVEFLRNLTLPSLRRFKYNLHLGYSPSRDDLRFDDLINFLTRSELDATSLQTFCLKICYHSKVRLDYDASGFFELKALTDLSFELNISWCSSEFDMDPLFDKMADIAIFPHLREIRVESWSESTLKLSSWFSLCNFVTEHNETMKSDTRESLAPTTSILADRVHSHDPISGSDSSLGGKHRHSLKAITISTTALHPVIRMKKQDLLGLQEAQRVGALHLQILNKGQDVLQNPQYTCSEESDIIDLQFSTKEAGENEAR